MLTPAEDKNYTPVQARLLKSLAEELKNPLILIARQAEMDNHVSIQRTAEHTLQLIDSYLLIAQTEYGQKVLPLETVGIGSVIYEVISEFRPLAEQRGIDLSMQIKDANVMAHRAGLKSALWCLTELCSSSADNGRKQVKIQTAKQGEKILITVLGEGLELAEKDVELNRRLQGQSRLAAAGKLDDSGVRLAIADTLATTFGQGIKVKKSARFTGFGFDVMNSRQLTLV